MLLLAVVPAVASVGLIAAVGEGSPPGASRGEAADPPHLQVRLLAPDRRVVAVLTVFALTNFPDALLLRLHDIGFGVAAMIGTYMTYNLVYASLSYPFGAVSDRWLRQRILAVGLVAFVGGYLGRGITRSHAVVWLLLAGYGCFTVAIGGVWKAWAWQLAGPARRDSGVGVFQASQSAVSSSPGSGQPRLGWCWSCPAGHLRSHRGAARRIPRPVYPLDAKGAAAGGPAGAVADG